MKKLLFIFLLILSAQFTIAQENKPYPQHHSLGSDSSVTTVEGALKSRLINWSYSDTTEANLEHINRYPGAQIRVKDNIWHRSDDTTRWILNGSTGSAINDGLLSVGGITLLDSTLTIQHDIKWSIKGVTYVRNTDTSFIIRHADSGYYRRDLIYANSTGKLYKLEGIEDTLIAAAPNLPDGAINITIVDVYGKQLAPPAATIIGKIPNLQQVTNEGNTTTNPIIINNNTSQSSVQINGDFNRSYYWYEKNANSGNWANTGIMLKNDVPDNPNDEHTGHFLQILMGSTNSSFMKDGAMIRSNGTGGLRLTADSGRLVFGNGAPWQPKPWIEFGSFETNGGFKVNKYKNNAAGDSILTTDTAGNFKMQFNVDPHSFHGLKQGSDTSFVIFVRPDNTEDTLFLIGGSGNDTTNSSIGSGLVNAGFGLANDNSYTLRLDTTQIISTPNKLGLVKIGKGLTVNAQGLIQAQASLLTPKSVPFVGSDGNLTENNSTFYYDGNLHAGNGGFYNQSGIYLNNGYGQVTANGFGVNISTPFDLTKSVSFYNGSFPYAKFRTGATSDSMYFDSYMTIYPHTNNYYSLGNLTNKWLNIYSKNGKFDSLYVQGIDSVAAPSTNFVSYNSVTKKFERSLAPVGGSSTASNGLTKVGNDIQLGGILSKNDTLNMGGAFSIRFIGSQPVYMENVPIVQQQTVSGQTNDLFPSIINNQNGYIFSRLFKIMGPSYTTSNNTGVVAEIGGTLSTQHSGGINDTLVALDITTTSNSTNGIFYGFRTNGKVKFNKYGLGNFTGTLTKSLGVDLKGNVIEYDGVTPQQLHDSIESVRSTIIDTTILDYGLLQDSMTKALQLRQNLPQNINSRTVNYTLDVSDVGKVITINSPTTTYLSIPSTLKVGFNCTVIQLGTGQIIFSGSGTTLKQSNNYTKTLKQYSVVRINCVATNLFILDGEMQ